MQKYRIKYKKINVVNIVNSTKVKTIIIGYMCKMMLIITENTKINKMFKHLASKLKKQIAQKF